MKALLTKIRKILRDRRTRQLLTRIVTAFAAFVVFVTTYALVLPAITMEREADCGIEAHQHDDSCYEDVLICGLEESEGHTHTEACYSVRVELNCDLPEHAHGESCYDAEGNLICQEKEHRHGDECYKEVKELVCEVPESDGHTHDASCYEKRLVCGKEAHTHSAACYSDDNTAQENGIPAESSAVASTESILSAGREETGQEEIGVGEIENDASPTDVVGTDGAEDFTAEDGRQPSEKDDSGLSEDLSVDWSEGTGTGSVSGGNTDAGNTDTENTAEENTAGDNTVGGNPVPGEREEPLLTDSDNVENAGNTETAGSFSTAAAADGTAAAGYVPVLEELAFDPLLNKNTGIYYFSASEGRTSGEYPSAGQSGNSDNSEETLSDAGGSISSADVTDWKKVDKKTELGGQDLLRVYLAYTIEAGSLNETNSVARYRLPANLHLTEDQKQAINENVNGIAGQYVSLDTLEILDPDQYTASLGIEAAEGTRTPDQDINDYLKDLENSGAEAAEYISATVKAEDIFDEVTGDYAGTDLVFTFTPYTIQKNRHEYDENGQPTKAGEKVKGWVTLDLNPDQIDWIEEENSEAPVPVIERKTVKTAEIVFAEKDRDLGTDKISTELKLVEKTVAEAPVQENAEDLDDSEDREGSASPLSSGEAQGNDKAGTDGSAGTDGTANDAGTDGTAKTAEDARTDETAEAANTGETAEIAAEDKMGDTADPGAEAEQETELHSPAVSFEESIRVSAGRLSTDTADTDPDRRGDSTKITVHVEADENTFPEGTTMLLSAVEDMNAVAEAVEGAVNASQTKGFHAVDISFRDASGKEIEPRKAIRVNMTSDAIRRAVEDASTAPVVVHLEESNSAASDQMPAEGTGGTEAAAEAEAKAEAEAEPASDKGTDMQGQTPEQDDEQQIVEQDEAQEASQEADAQEVPSSAEHAAESADSMNGDEREKTETSPTATIIEAVTGDAAKDADLTFESGSFSVYAIVYTVDFHYEINGKLYEFSIPGGGFVSLEHVVEVLGIATADENSENGAENAENGAENGDDSVEEVPGVDEDGENGEGGAEEGADGETSPSSDSPTYEEAIKLNEVDVSEATKKFVADVESVEFSSPELVWAGKVDEVTTVGGLKEANGLQVEYSAELTEEQIAEINRSTVEAGDWVLISVQPFTSEETLTVTMKNGDQWTVKVTDAQKPYKDVESLENGTYLIYNSFDSSRQAVFMKNDGTSYFTNSTTGVAINASDLSDYTWTVTKNSNGTFTIKSTKGNTYVNLWGNNHDNKDEFAGSTSANLTLETTSSGITISYGNKKLQRRTSGSKAGFYVHSSTYGLTPLTFFKIENNPSGGSTGATGIELTDEERAELSKWEETIAKFNTLTDYNKTAEVSDYDNRIYKIDLEADSGVMDFYKDVDLGFVLDVSNSMKFPSSLKALEDQQGNEFKLWMDAASLNSAYWAYQEYYNRQGCFYILSDPALTSTIYRVFRNGSKWQYQDASSNDPAKIYDINNGTTFKEPFRQSYTLYYADDQTQRIDYLNNSVAQAVATLKKIVQPTEGSDDETANVRIAYNFFAGTKTTNGVITQYAIRGSHDFVDLRSQESRSFEVVPKGNEADGTRQDLALYDSNNDPNLGANEFGWKTNSNVDRYVILVTDGAPNGASMAEVEAAARRLKTEDNVKLITIGLSTKDVDGGSTLLKTIADDVDGDGTKDFYEAEKASDLKHILLKILQTLMTKGIVKGTITDTIDSAFYPVDSSGNPLSPGVYNSSGVKLGDNVGEYVTSYYKTIQTDDGSNTYLVRETQITDPFYTWEQVDGKWKITWYNQEIGWNDNDSTTGTPWNGTVYVKAKEDYLGGNLIETNDSADIEPTGIKLIIDGNPEENWRPLEGMPHVGLPDPRVNVHNLETDENETTWTVYKGTSITPKEQLKALWNAIPIEEVVSASENGQHKRTTGASANVGTAGAGETFTLGSLMSEVAPSFNIDSLINQITASNSSASQEFTYSAYGHESGKITVKVERTVGDQTPATHTANTIGTPTEQYKVTFTYKPYTEAERMNGRVKDPNDPNHHNGSNGRGTEETGEIKSENIHTINVFQKGIKVTKVDATDNNQILPGAVFELFQVDSNGSVNGSDYGLPSGSYTKVGGNLTADSNGVITINPVIPDQDPSVTNKTLYEPNINVGETTETSHDTEFYLVEKTPPTKDGVTYAKMPGAIKFTMTLSEDKGNDSTATLYNWTQTAVISVQEHGNGTTEYLINDAANTTTGTNSDVYAYKLKNGRATDITLIKVDKVTQNSIGGAKFSLLKGSENVDLTKLIITAISGGAAVTPEDYDFNGTTIKVVTVPEGGIRIAGLTDDTYTLREVSAPAGYVITDSGKVFKTENGAIKNTDDSAHQNEATDIAFEVENEPGAALPNTGGPGITLIYLLGIMLTAFAGAGLAMRKRRRDAA